MWPRRSKKILIVDDEALVSRLLVKFVNRDGNQAYEARSVSEALSVFEAHKPFDAILCDLDLGGERGWDVVEQIYALQPSIIIVMLTGHHDVGLGPPGLPYSVIRKPFTPSELKAILDSLW